MALIVFLIGQAGSGKGTQARFLEQAGFLNLSMSHILRTKGVINPSTEGDDGKNADCQKTIGAIREYVEGINHGDKVVVDGFPRSETQARYLIKHFAEKSGYILNFVILDVPDETCWEQIDGRVINGENRSGDHPAVRAERFRIYRQEQVGLEAYLADAVPNSTHVINGVQPEEEVAADIQKRISERTVLA